MADKEFSAEVAIVGLKLALLWLPDSSGVVPAQVQQTIERAILPLVLVETANVVFLPGQPGLPSVKALSLVFHNSGTECKLVEELHEALKADRELNVDDSTNGGRRTIRIHERFKRL